jgi:uncharacterized protein YdeI (YjbR/CyaY-like superfamily)
MKTSTTPKPELSIMLFELPKDWATWLDKYQATSPGLWLRLAKKAASIHSITYAEALDVALCYGWIDGHKKAYDADSWLQKFTPRRPKSIWSQINTAKAEQLIANGQMKPAGLKAIEQAKQDGRWAAAYASQSKIEMPEDLQAALVLQPQKGTRLEASAKASCAPIMTTSSLLSFLATPE